jgi:hypothetical protein
MTTPTTDVRLQLKTPKSENKALTGETTIEVLQRLNNSVWDPIPRLIDKFDREMEPLEAFEKYTKDVSILS